MLECWVSSGRWRSGRWRRSRVRLHGTPKGQQPRWAICSRCDVFELESVSVGTFGDTPKQAVARAYIDSLLSHDSSAVKFAPGARRVENGVTTGFSGPRLSKALNKAFYYRSILAIRDIELTESGDTVHARFLIDAGLRGRRLVTVRVEERFLVPDGTIHFIRARLRIARGRRSRIRGRY